MLREEDQPTPVPLDLDWMMWAECAELTVTEADRLFFCGQGRSRLAS